MSGQQTRSNVRTFERLNVLLVVSSYLPNVGGLQSVTAQLASELKRRGYCVEVLTNKYPRALPAAETIDGIRVQRWHFLAPRWRDLQNGRLGLFFAGLFYLPLTLLRLVWRIAREKPQVVNLHFVGASSVFLLIARMLIHFRFVVSLHGDDVEGLPRMTWFDRWVFRETLRQADAVTACSRYLLGQAQAVDPSIGAKARVIYNGMNLDTEPSPNLSPEKEAGQGVELLGVGRLVTKKGFDVLLHAFAKCQNVNGHIGLTLIGDGPERHALESLTSRLGLAARVVWRGSQSHTAVMQAMRESCMVVVPSREEPFGLVALEAMSIGKPIVAARVGGMPEVLAGADSVLVEADDPAMLAQAIAQTLTRLEHEPDFGARNREIASRFSVNGMVEGYLNVYIPNRMT